MRPLSNNVESRPIAVRWEEANRLTLRLTILANLFGQTDGGERAARAEPLVVGDGRPFRRSPPLSRRASSRAVHAGPSAPWSSMGTRTVTLAAW